MKNKIDECKQNLLLNNGKDKVPVKIQRGIYKIPCSYSKHVRRTQQNLENRLQQQKNAIDCSLKHNNKKRLN